MRWVIKYRYVFGIGAILSLLVMHSMNEVTGRFQFLFMPEPQLKTIAIKEYKQFKRENTILGRSSAQVAMVERVGKRLTRSIEKLYSSNDAVIDQLKSYDWEYCVIESPEVNAWCLPGGKIIVYSGLIHFAKTESALAIVMGHEIAHALARHGNERMSYSMLLSGIGIVGEIALAQQLTGRILFHHVFPQYGRYHALLPALREQELEADKFGLVFAAYAGYDPREAITLWSSMHKGNIISETDFSSTHPSEVRRVTELKSFMPIALEFYRKN